MTNCSTFRLVPKAVNWLMNDEPSRPPMVDKNEIQVCLGSLLNWRMGEFSKYTCREHLIGKF